MENLKVNQEICIGCGACAAIASEAFEFNDDGLAQVKDNFELDKASDETKNDVVDAIEGCPTGAISK